MDCRMVNSSWKTIMDQPTFWLRKMNMSDMPKDAQKSWKMIALKLELISLVRNEGNTDTARKHGKSEVENFLKKHTSKLSQP